MQGQGERGCGAKKVRAARPPLSLDLGAEEGGLGAALALRHCVVSGQVLVTIRGDPHVPLLNIDLCKEIFQKLYSHTI